jgi:serine protease Do
MKSIVSIVLAGVVGGLVVLGANKLISKPKLFNNNNENISKNVSFDGGEGVVDLADAAAKASPTVVFIQASESEKNARKRMEDRPYSPFDMFFGDYSFHMPKMAGTGSGVIISEDGYIVTNNHVIDFADEVSVTLTDNRKFNASVVGRDPKSDLAVLKISANGLTAIAKGNSDNLSIGNWVLAIGNPYDLGTTVTAGIISAKGKSINVNKNKEAVESFIQTDAVVNPGNSGGALVDGKGRLVGINTAIQTHTGSYEGYSFAIPVNLMTKVVEDIISHGKVIRPFLGIEVADLNDIDAKSFGIKVNKGVFVDNVVEGGSAQYAGLLPKDVVTTVNGTEVNSAADLIQRVQQYKVGDVLTLTVNRFGKMETIPVKLKERKDNN